MDGRKYFDKGHDGGGRRERSWEHRDRTERSSTNDRGRRYDHGYADSGFERRHLSPTPLFEQRHPSPRPLFEQRHPSPRPLFELRHLSPRHWSSTHHGYGERDRCEYEGQFQGARGPWDRDSNYESHSQAPSRRDYDYGNLPHDRDRDYGRTHGSNIPRSSPPRRYQQHGGGAGFGRCEPHRVSRPQGIYGQWQVQDKDSCRGYDQRERGPEIRTHRHREQGENYDNFPSLFAGTRRSRSRERRRVDHRRDHIERRHVDHTRDQEEKRHVDHGRDQEERRRNPKGSSGSSGHPRGRDRDRQLELESEDKFSGPNVSQPDPPLENLRYDNPLVLKKQVSETVTSTSPSPHPPEVEGNGKRSHGKEIREIMGKMNALNALLEATEPANEENNETFDEWLEKSGRLDIPSGQDHIIVTEAEVEQDVDDDGLEIGQIDTVFSKPGGSTPTSTAGSTSSKSDFSSRQKIKPRTRRACGSEAPTSGPDTPPPSSAPEEVQLVPEVPGSELKMFNSIYGKDGLFPTTAEEVQQSMKELFDDLTQQSNARLELARTRLNAGREELFGRVLNCTSQVQEMRDGVAEMVRKQERAVNRRTLFTEAERQQMDSYTEQLPIMPD